MKSPNQNEKEEMIKVNESDHPKYGNDSTPSPHSLPSSRSLPTVTPSFLSASLNSIISTPNMNMSAEEPQTTASLNQSNDRIVNALNWTRGAVSRTHFFLI